MSDYTQTLLGSESSPLKASDKIPTLAQNIVSERAKKTLDLLEQFVEEECIPGDELFEVQLGKGEGRWKVHPPIMEELKAKARKLQLWNLFLPKSHFKEGAGFSNLEFGLMAEYLGKSRIASEATNSSAPDTGNMECLAKYANDDQKKCWLEPLLAGTTRSAFLMTEPQVASSDATNVRFTIKREGEFYILNGSKWWSSGIGDSRCENYLVFGKSSEDNPDPYKRHSVIVVHRDTPGIVIHRMLNVYGYDDAPHGHGHVTFTHVKVPAANLLLDEGRGFEIVQGRLGPGRIHHAMRAIGAAEKALDLMLARINDPMKKPFGKLLNEHGVIIQWIAKSRSEIDAARLVVLNAAAKIDDSDTKGALKEIAEAKIIIPQMALKVIDRAVQVYGGQGVCQDTPLANMWAQARVLRIVDGPDEVHLQQLGRKENRRGKDVIAKLKAQMKTVDALFRQNGIPIRAVL